MPIYSIDDVKINGKNQAFGGLIYSVDYDVGLLDKPSTVTVNFINESGVYLEPDLSVTKPYRIEIGNIISENFYAISRTISRSSGGRTLEVTFQDGSILLDRIWVGLYKKNGDDKTNIPGLIILGREVHPCDVNDDGIFDQKDADLLSWQAEDPCELRCPTESSETEPVIENCIKREITDLFEVKYSFDDLMDALSGSSSSEISQPRKVAYPVEGDLSVETSLVNVTLPPMLANKNANKTNRVKIALRPQTTNKFYLSNYTGTLREVLRNWCADFGWSFYWENDSLNFIDTKERPKINLQAFANLESETDTRTIEGTVSRGFISHYAQGGIEAQKDCSQSRAILLRCLTLRDLYGSFYKPAWNAAIYTQNDYSSLGSTNPPTPDASDASPDNQIEYVDDFNKAGVPIENFETSCVCSYYSDTLRHLYNLWDYYGIRSAQDAESAKGKWMDRLGQMKIVNVFSASSVGDNLTTFNRLMGDEKKDDKGQTLLSTDEVAHIKKYNGYIVVALRKTPRASQREDLLDKQFRLEENVASNFIGQHWYRSYIAPHYGETPQIFPNGQYFGALSTNVRDLPFASFNHTYKSNIANMVSSFVQRQRNDYRQYGALKFAQDFSKNISKKLVRSLIYFGRNCSEAWSPLKNSETQLSATLKELENYMFKNRPLEDFSTTDIQSLVTVGGTALVRPELYPYLELFVFYPAPKTGFKVSSEVTDHPLKENFQHTEGVEPFALATAGLLSNKCARYSINGTPIFTPVGGSILLSGDNERFRWNFRQPERRDFDAPAYKVFVTSSTSNRGIVSKTESTIIEPASPDEALKVEYQVKEITRDAVQMLNRLTSDCTLSTADIKAIHEKLATNLNYSVTQPFNSKSYRIMGLTVPSKLSIRDGLESLKVRVSNEGVFTDIGVGDSLFTPPSPDLVQRALELHQNTDLANFKAQRAL